MTRSMRVFFFLPDGTMKKISVAKLSRLTQGKDRFPEYAGLRIRQALVAIQPENRRPSKIVYTEYSYLSFDSNGVFEKASLDEKRLSAESLDVLSDSPGNIIDMRSGLAKLQHQSRITWIPTESEIAAIEKAVFKK